MGNKSFRTIGAVNTANSNLTELNATDAVNGGFIDHADWLAHIMRYAVVMDYLKHNKVGKPVRILDVGCGKLPLLTFIWRNRVPLTNVQYTGIDLRANEKWLDISLPTAPDIELVRMDIIADDPSSIGQYDIVVCTEMMEHIDKVHAPELMKRLKSWMKPDGILFLSSPNLGGSDTVAENHTAANGDPREWTYEGKVKLLNMFGFEILDSLGTFIRLDHLDNDFLNEETIRVIRRRLPNSFFRVLVAAAFPEHSNNAMFICKLK